MQHIDVFFSKKKYFLSKENFEKGVSFEIEDVKEILSNIRSEKK